MLALGLGANLAIVALVQGVVWHPLAYSQPEQLYAVREVLPRIRAQYPSLPVNYLSFDAWRRQARTLAGVALVHPATLDMTGAGEPRQVVADQVSANLLTLLGVRPELGRGFAPGEDAPGRNHSILLTDGFWHSQFGGDLGVLGRQINLSGTLCTVVGVLPADFYFPPGAAWGTFVARAAAVGAPQIFQPLGLDAHGQAAVGNFDYAAIARLRPGVDAAASRAELDLITARLVASAQGSGWQVFTQFTPLRDQVVGGAGRQLALLLAAVAALLLLVCINLATLLLARAHARAPEAALRLALGASLSRLVRSQLLEAGILALAGWAGALGLANAGLAALRRAAPDALPRLASVHLGLVSVGLGLGLAFAACLAFALGPALQWARSCPQTALQASNPTLAGSGRVWARRTLVGAEAAATALLLMVAGLLLRSLAGLDQIAPGYTATHSLVVATELSGPNPLRRRLWDGISPAVTALPGVAATGLSTELPLQGTGYTTTVIRPGDVGAEAERPVTSVQFVSPGYFAALGIPMLQGRAFRTADEPAAGAPPNALPDVAILSAATAQRLFPGQDAVGKTFHLSAPTDPQVTVVGVAADVRTDLRRAPGAMVYQPYWDDLQRPLAYVVVRPAAGADTGALQAAVRQAIARLEPATAIPSVETMAAVRAASTAPQRFQLWLLLPFALTALLLASLGIYGVVANAALRRRRELGIRHALGAEPAALAKLVFRQGMTPVLVGIAAAVVAALLLGRALAAQLYGVSAADPWALAGGAAVVLAVAAIACGWPAWRASRADPLTALRN